MTKQQTCGGCDGLGGHSPRCPQSPGWVWRRLAAEAERIALHEAATPDEQNVAWAAEGWCKNLANKAARAAAARAAEAQHQP